MKTRIFLLTIILSIISLTKCKAQAFVGFHPIISISNPIYTFWPMACFDGLSFIKRRPFIPIINTKFPLKQKITTPLGNADIKAFDWRFKNYSLGYCFGFMDPTYHFGMLLTLNYEKQNWNCKLPSKKYVDYSKNMFTPEILLRAALGENYFALSLILEVGARYNNTLKAKGEYNNKNYVNNGVTSIYGLGINLLGAILTFRVEHDNFDFFNQDFVSVNNTKPYQGYKTKHTMFAINYSVILFD